MNIESLLDERLGPIQKVEQVQNEYAIFSEYHTYSATINKISQYLNWRPDFIGSGTSLDKNKAYYAAIGEAIERYCGNFIPNNLMKSTINGLKDDCYLSPNVFLQFTKEQMNRKGFPFSTFKDDEVFEWSESVSLTDNKKYWIPAEFVYLNYWLYRKDIKKVQQRPILLSGIAAGQNTNHATISGLLEIIERDSTMIWWLGRQSQTEILVSKGDFLYQKIIKGLPASYEIRWYLLPSDFSVYTVACSLIDLDNQIFSLGFATRFSANEALEKSAGEAFQLRKLSLNLLDRSNQIWKDPNYKDYLGIKNYRKDRNYAQSFNNDWKDMYSLMHNVQYFLDPTTWDWALKRLESKEKVLLKNMCNINSNNQLNYLIEEFRKNKMSAYLVDVTTEDILQTNYRVVRVISPEACPNMPTGLPMLNNNRLLEKINLSSEKNSFDLSPMPHS
ncbi:YcaO-like family protein [Virgibacillus dokdonensis]|uniref:YcaO-like family protein n=1 Tax=Virgibacillus dokdonensis TaxID=302167 RepID=A0ABU7VKT1_9BACI